MSKKNKVNKTLRFVKNSKLSVIGEEGKKEMLSMRVQGQSFNQIKDFLNIKYGKLLTDDGRKLFTAQNIFSFFKRTKTAVNKLKRYKYDTFKKGFDNSGNINNLMKTLNGWLDEYKEKGEKLPLKQTINYLIKLYDLRVKIDQIEKDNNTDDSKNMVKEFISKVQNEFSTNPKVTKEVEIKYNRDGLVTSKKAKITQSMEDEDIVEEFEEEDEDLREDIKVRVKNNE